MGTSTKMGQHLELNIKGSPARESILYQGELDKILAYDDYKYTKKHKLGSQVKTLINKNGYNQDSLRSEYKEALDLHLKKSLNSFPKNVECKSLITLCKFIVICYFTML